MRLPAFPHRRLALALATLSLCLPSPLAGQGRPVQGTIVGTVSEAQSGQPIAFASISVEGTRLGAVSDSTGHYVLGGVPPGPHVLVAQRLGYADARVYVTMPPKGGVLLRDISMATSALEVEGLTVTANPSSRARGELGTASVIEKEAIENQSAASLQGVLELIPGVPIAPPGLEDVEQFGLRSVPTASQGVGEAGPSAAELASFGTLIVLDGVPLSNNANLQTVGPRGEVNVTSTAGGGVDLRRIPASTIERVEVIRGVPSARWGDVAEGAIIVDTRAGRIEPTARGRVDPRLTEGSFLAGAQVSRPQVLSGTFDATNSDLAGVVGGGVTRLATQVSHRATWGAEPGAPGASKGALDTRLDFFQLLSDNPEDTVANPGRSSATRDRGFRFSERARLVLGRSASLGITAAVDYKQRRSFSEAPLVRGAAPFTDRLTEGRSVGKFVLGEYQARVDVDGDEWFTYARFEEDGVARFLGFDHRIRPGLELRREWNTGPGVQFDIERPPQESFDGVTGYDRPRSFDQVPPVAVTAAYLDDQLTTTLGGGVALDAQLGLRLELLHDGSTWFSGVRDAAVQPRLNLQIAPLSWLRLRGGWGLTAKQPSVGQLHPAPQYFDLVNVNFFANDPDERLAVLTTSIRDPTNPDLGFSTTRKAEVGFELGLGPDASLGLTAFDDRTGGGVGFRERPDFLLRDRFQLTDSVVGNGVKPEIIEPPFAVDTVPILIQRPSNNLTLENRGIELTASLPELRPLRTRLDVLGAWVRSEFTKDGLDFGTGFNDFQLDDRIRRVPFWENPVRTGERLLLSYRLIHHQPALGLVVTATIEHIAIEKTRNVAGTDTLAFAGYMTRAGKLVRVPRDRRGEPQFADLRVPRSGLLLPPVDVPGDWFASLQISKTLPRGGRLSFFAFNALDRRGTFTESGRGLRFFLPLRFGVEASLPIPSLLTHR